MRKFTMLLVMFVLTAFTLQAQDFTYPDTWGKPGFNLVSAQPNRVQVVFSLPEFSMQDLTVKGIVMKNITVPGTFLFNDEGMPNLPGKGEYIAIPQGATPKLKIISLRTDLIHNVEIAPAPRIPLDNDRNPLDYTPNPQVYSKNAYYPASPVQMSEVMKIRGVDVVMIGVTPFQYNPVTKDLIVYSDIKVDVDFEGGNGQYGDPAFRSTWWDPILQDNIMNYHALPVIDYNARLQSYGDKPLTDECEYIIICPTGPSFLSWADSLRKFRLEQGILTKVFTVDEVGGNTTVAIEGFIDNAYNTWTIKPAACLILGDYGTDGTKNVISPLLPHSGGYPNFASDNKYADVDNDQLPDVVFARITANDATQLQVMCSKILNHERNPPVDPLFYDKPVTALGWQTERWFQLCSEIVGGYFRNEQDKHPRRINAIYQGTPGSSWSSATNTATIVSYFGPSGLGYIPQTPAEMPCCWNGGTSTKINQAIDSGAFMVMHRDHGNYTEWGEPAYNTANAMQLNNTAMTYIFSINCETGAYHRSSDCLGEKFHRQFKNGHNAGSSGFIAPTETSYSFVNDTFVWGMMDNMWPDFMPLEGTEPGSRGILPAFGHAAGKYFLQRSNWPYNTGNKAITHQMFHMHGDAFQVLYSEVPQLLTVTHDPEILYGSTTFSIQTNDSAFIALTSGDELLAVAYGSVSGPVSMTIPQLPVGTQVLITVTKQNYFRYTDIVTVTSQNVVANFSANNTSVCVGSTVNFSDLSSGTPTTWAWEFPGGTPATSTEQNPTGILYDQAGSYDVTLTASKSGAPPSTLTKPGFVEVINMPITDFEDVTGCPGTPVQFNDRTNPNGGTLTNWAWTFGDPASGAADTSYHPNPEHTYNTPGTYSVSLTTTVNGICTNQKVKEIIINSVPEIAAKPSGNIDLCKNATGIEYTTEGATGASTYTWMIQPETAGTITGTGTTGTLALAQDFTGGFTLTVQGSNECGNGLVSEELAVNVIAPPDAPVKPVGSDSVDVNKVASSDFSTTEVPGALTYAWSLTPAEAGSLTPNGLTATAAWDKNFRGVASVKATAANTCGDGPSSEVKSVKIYSTVGVSEKEGIAVELFPNPNDGKFVLDIRSNVVNRVHVTLINNLGIKVFSARDLKVSGSLHKTFDIPALAKGIYTLKVEGGDFSSTLKMVVDK